MKLRKILTLAAIAMACTTSFAGIPRSDVGFYASLDGGLSFQDNANNNSGQQSAYGVTVGYNLNRDVGIEVNVSDLGRRDISYGQLGSFTWKAKAQSMSVVDRTELVRGTELSAKI